MNANFIRVAFWVWAAQMAVSAFNYFVLMNHVYEPRYGALRAHQIGMGTRIVYIFASAWFLVRFETHYTTLDLVYAGLFWVVLMLAFEWGGQPGHGTARAGAPGGLARRARLHVALRAPCLPALAAHRRLAGSVVKYVAGLHRRHRRRTR